MSVKKDLARAARQWPTATQVIDLLLYRSASGKHRKWRLFGSACASRTLVLLPEWPCFREAVLAAERFADGELSWDEVKQTRQTVSSARRALRKEGVRAGQEEAIEALLTALAKEPYLTLGTDQRARFAFADSTRPDWDAGHDGEEREQMKLARDIFHNPFRPVAVDPAWRTSSALAVAREIYEDRSFSSLPILGDALRDAGCENVEVLGHCQSAGPHVRGCWVVDLILEKP